MLEVVHKDGAVDYLALDKGDLVVEFALSGLTKRFQRIGTGLGESWYSRGKSLSVMIDEKDLAMFEVVVELHDADFSGHNQLKRISIDTFATQDDAGAAALKIKKLFGLSADCVDMVEKPDALDFLTDSVGNIRSPSRFAEFVSNAVVPAAVCAVAVLVIGAAFFMAAAAARAIKDGIHVTVVLDNEKKGQLAKSAWANSVSTQPVPSRFSADMQEKVLELQAAPDRAGKDEISSPKSFIKDAR